MTINNIKNWSKAHAPELLTGVGIVSFIAATALAIKETPRALKILENKEKEKGEELTPIEIVKSVWKVYLPCVISTVSGVTCIIGAVSVHNRQKAALVTAFNLSEQAFNRYRSKVIETLGEKEDKRVREEIAQEKVNSSLNNTPVIVANSGKTLCMDAISGRYFMSDINEIKRAVNEINARLNSRDWISLTEWYSEIGLEPIKDSSYLGWSINTGLIEVLFEATITKENVPCIVVDYNRMPNYML